MDRVDDWQAFRERWAGPHNFLMSGETTPFDFAFPDLDRVVAEMRDDPDARILSGARGDTLVQDDISEAFRRMPMDEAMRSSFSLAHFKLRNFDRPGGFLHGFEQRVLDPWRAALTAAGYTFDRCYPIIFISAAGCSTNYHMDFSHVLAWQTHGEKRFCGLTDPDRHAPRDARLHYKPGGLTRPAGLAEDDILAFVMKPGDVLWNVLLTPHWVDAGEEAAMSVNLSHGGLRLRGELSPNEAELEAFRAAEPQTAPGRLNLSY